MFLRFFIPPRDSGEGGPRSCAVGGARASTLVLRPTTKRRAEAPSTTLRMLPLPRCAGADAMHSRSRAHMRARVLSINNVPNRHCEERSDEAIQNVAAGLDCFASLAMTNK